MTTIDTSKKGWQKKMSNLMKRKEKFTLITSDPELAKALEKGKFTNKILKLIIYGSATVAGAGTIAAVGGGTAIVALADPEPVTKIVLMVICGVLILAGLYWL